MFEITGTLKLILDEQTFGSGFNKREFVVTTRDDKYPQDIKFETVKDRTSLLDGLKPGTAVKVAFDIRGREYKGNYYVNLNAFRINREEGGADPVEEFPDPYDGGAEEPPF